MALRDDQVRRYARHVLLPDVGGVGQERLLASAVRVEIGPGRDAEVAALIYLAAAGVGTLALAGDVDGAVTASELAGGIAYGAADLGRPRLAALAARIAAINPDVRVAADRAPGIDTPPPATPTPLAVAAGAWSDAARPSSRPAGVADALVRAGTAATALLYHLALHGPDARRAPDAGDQLAAPGDERSTR